MGILGKDKLKFGIFKRQGRDSHGRITVRGRGGGCKRKFVFVDNKGSLLGIPAKVISIEGGKQCTGNVGLVCYSCGILSKILLSDNVGVGDFVMRFDGLFYGEIIVREGSAVLLREVNVGDSVHSIEKFPGSGAVYLRSAGMSGIVVKKFEAEGLVYVRFGKGYIRIFSGNCQCVVGVVSNGEHRYGTIGMAGVNRGLGKRPSVGGVAMNPVDHPHGGGEGKTSGGGCSVTPWGKLTKGKKTVRNKKNKFVLEQ